jgi:hypothetical protein
MSIESSHGVPSRAWAEALAEIAHRTDQAGFLLRLANYTNQRKVAARLARFLDALRSVRLTATLIGKPGNGAPLLAEQLTHSLAGEHMFAADILEAPDYSEIAADAWERARNSSAIVFVIPALAPLFDETGETIAKEFVSAAGKLFVAISSDDADPAPIAAEVKQVLNVPVHAADNLAPALSSFLAATYLTPLLKAEPDPIESSRRDLQPALTAFAEFLSLSHNQYQRRIEFIRKDLEALNELGQQAANTLRGESQTALNGAASALSTLALTMRQQAEAVVQGAGIPADVLGNQELRTRFGRNLIPAARSAGYREFEMRLQSVAMNLNSARSLLFSNLDQLREEAAAHVEELSLNIGPGLYAAWMNNAAQGWGERPFDLSLDPGTAFPEAVASAARKVRTGIPELGFSSGWATGRIEAMFRSELASSAVAGWTAATIEAPVTAAIAQTWRDTTERACGLLIGRIHTVVSIVSANLSSSRLDSLQIPRDPDARIRISSIFREFGNQLETMQAIKASPNGALMELESK